MQSLSKFQWYFSQRNRMNRAKICMELQKTLNSQSKCEKNKAGDTMFLHFKLYYKALWVVLS